MAMHVKVNEISREFKTHIDNIGSNNHTMPVISIGK
jgi:hypothetical protein